MKILYAIQGTGNGHLARAEDIVPILRKKGDLDIFVSGAQADLTLPYPIDHRSQGLSFYFGKNGGVDLVKTFKKNKSRKVYKEISDFPIKKYDVVINDFEPISAWAAHLKKVPCIALSHQASLLSTRVPKPDHHDLLGLWILRNYAPASAHVGFHFKEFDKDIFTPVIRSRVRNADHQQKDHYTVYLPSYEDKKLVPLLNRFRGVKWHVFSKHIRVPFHVNKVSVFPINSEAFSQSMASSTGVLCGAGFETPAEALYLRKKLMVVPMKKQYEQHYNAAALKELGVPVIKKLKKKNLPKIEAWLENDSRINLEYDDVAEGSVIRAMEMI
jgi:uncharacterized protein (TIGR00661 family)